MTKQEAVQKVQEEIERLGAEGQKSRNPYISTAAFAVAEKLKWAISIFQQVEEETRK